MPHHSASHGNDENMNRTSRRAAAEAENPTILAAPADILFYELEMPPVPQFLRNLDTTEARSANSS